MKELKLKKSPTPISSRRLNSLTTLELFLMSLSELYPKDALSPGLVLSWLPSANRFYVSVCRYNSRLPEGKEMLSSCVGETADEAIRKLAEDWLGTHQSSMQFARSLSGKRRRKAPGRTRRP